MQWKNQKNEIKIIYSYIYSIEAREHPVGSRFDFGSHTSHQLPTRQGMLFVNALLEFSSDLEYPVPRKKVRIFEFGNSRKC